MIRKQCLWRVFFASLSFNILPFYVVLVLKMDNMTGLFLFSMGGELFSPLSSIQSLLTSFTPSLILFFSLSDFFSSDFEAMAVYIFTRSVNPMKYLVRKILYLIVCVGVYTILNSFFCFVLGMIFGLPTSNINISTLLGCMLLFFLNHLLLVGLINLLSIQIKSHYAFFLISALYMVGILIFLFLNQNTQKIVYYLIPFFHGFYAWHGESSAFHLLFSLSFSVVYLVAMLLLECVIFYKYVKRYDFI